MKNKLSGFTIYLVFVFIFILLSTEYSEAQRRNTAPAAEMDMHHGLIFQRYHNKPFTGTAVETYPNGNRAGAVPIVEGKLHGTAKEWAINGQLILESNFENGLQVGKETQWYEDGTLKAVAFYENDVLHGKAIEYHQNSNKKSEGIFTRGLEHGLHIWYYEDGSKEREIPFAAGVVEGLWREWHANGQLKMEANFNEGEANGPWNEWYASGGLRTSRNYVDGKEHGAFRLHTESGYLLEIDHYEQGELKFTENFRSGSVRVGSGYVVVVNKPGISYSMLIPGEDIRPVGNDDLAYLTDGKVVLLNSVNVQAFWDETRSDRNARNILEAYQQHTFERIKEETGSKPEVKAVHHKPEMRPEMLYWYISVENAPVSERSGRTIEEEHFVSVYLGSEILHLYVPKTNETAREDIRKLLTDIAQSVYKSNEAIDLNRIRVE